MEELIRITESNGIQVVSAKDLHDFVNRETRFDIWIKRMLEYGFIENVDYQCLNKNVQMPNGGVKIALDDYALTLDCAKEISMLQRNDKGKQARAYFIERDKKLAKVEQNMLQMPNFNNPAEAARAWADEYEKKQMAFKMVMELQPKANYHDKVLTSETSLTTTQVAKELGMSAIELNKILHSKGVQYKVRGQWVLTSKYHDRGYTSTKTSTFESEDGEVKTSHLTVWTEIGRKFIHSLLEEF